MKLENQVTNLELSRKLKELGVKQESLFWWVRGEMNYGYEGEWSIKEGDNYFLFDEVWAELDGLIKESGNRLNTKRKTNLYVDWAVICPFTE